MIVAFYVTMSATVLGVSLLFAQRFANYERGRPDNRSTTPKNVGKRLHGLRQGLFMQTLLRDPAAGIMHSLIYFPFLVLMGVTTVLEIDHQLPESAKFLDGGVYQAYSFIGDLAGLLFLVGITWAAVRRYIQRPFRIATKSRPEDAFILAILFALGFTGFLVEGARIALVGRPQFEQWSFVGYPMSAAFNELGADALIGTHRWLWVLHALTFVAFLIALPVTKLRHAVTSPLNLYLAERDRPKGAMKPLPDLTSTDLETFGAGNIEHFTWKQLFDTDACTVCGRCTEVCPAQATGKSLDPREIVLKVGHVMAATTPGGAISPTVSQDESIKVSTTSVFERITSEEVWECTSC